MREKKYFSWGNSWKRDRKEEGVEGKYEKGVEAIWL